MARTELAPLWPAYVADRSVANRNRIVERHLGLVDALADRLRRKLPHYVDVDDLRSDGYAGLIQAVERFDPARGYKFGTFASARIHGAMVDGLRARHWTARLARSATIMTRERSKAKLVSLESLRADGSRHFDYLVSPVPGPLGQMASGDACRAMLRNLSRQDCLIVQLHAEGVRQDDIAAAVGTHVSYMRPKRLGALARARAHLTRERATVLAAG